jgi:hypothetical protein
MDCCYHCKTLLLTDEEKIVMIKLVQENGESPRTGPCCDVIISFRINIIIKAD